MLGRVRRLPSPALFVASVALVFAVAGGVSFAASKINGGKIKKNSLSGNRLKKNTVTGKQIKESSLGKVPSATNATNANHANTADTANALSGGNPVQQFKFFANNNTTTDIATVQGALFQGACGAGVLTNTATVLKGSADNGIAKVDGVDEAQTAFNNSNDDLDTGDTVSLIRNAANTEVGAQAAYSAANGTQMVTANYGTEDDAASLAVSNTNCAIWGTLQTAG